MQGQMLLRATIEENTKGGASALASETMPMFFNVIKRGELAQLPKCLPHKHKDWSLDSSKPCKNQVHDTHV